MRDKKIPGRPVDGADRTPGVDNLVPERAANGSVEADALDELFDDLAATGNDVTLDDATALELVNRIAAEKAAEAVKGK
jgi:hypothetical protein